jgi:hypothetical protein
MLTEHLWCKKAVVARVVLHAVTYMLVDCALGFADLSIISWLLIHA